MKKFYPTCFALLLAGTLAFPSLATADKAKGDFSVPGSFPVAAFNGHRAPSIMEMPSNGGKLKKNVNRIKSDGTPDLSLKDVPDYGFLTGPDGKDWFFTQKYEENAKLFYSKVAINLYDGDNKTAGQINIDFGDDRMVNYVMPYGVLTNKFFDNDANTLELLVYVHEVTPDYVGKNTLLIYNTKGELVKEMDGYMATMFDASTSSWNTYQRLLIARDEIVEGGDGKKKEVQIIDVMRPASWGEEGIQVEHSFTIDFDLRNYSDGPCFSAFNVGGKPYYVVSHYRKPYATGYDNNGDIIVAEDNAYQLTVYDKNYNQVSQIDVPLNKPDDMLYRFAAFGTFSDDDLTCGRFTDDDKLNFVVTYYDYSTASDAYKYTFDVYNQEGEKVKNITESTDEGGFLRMADIPGQEEQWCFGHTDFRGQQYLEMVDIPSCKVVNTLPSEINGNTISTNFDRYPKGDSYQYVISLRNPWVEENGDVCGQVGWYNQDLSEDYIVKLNLGPKGIYCQPNINSMTLNPYLFDTSDSHEYIYLSSIERDDSDQKDIVLSIADGEGKPMQSFVGNDEKGAIRMVSILNSKTATPKLLLAYYDKKGEYSIETINLPLEKFAKGGEGTAESPYLVSTVGDLLQIAAAPAAHYKQVNGINFSNFNGSWTPLPAFAGVYDGDNHAINDLTINGSDEYRVGLFSSLDENAEVKNLFFNRPKFSLNDKNSYAGIVAGDAVGGKLTNVHVYDAEITTESPATIGGLIGNAALEGEISASSFNKGNIVAPEASPVGGIVGNMLTGYAVKATSASGNFEAESGLGGIVGSLGTNAKVLDSHADVSLKACNTIGGIAGENGSRGEIAYCYSQGTLEATEAGWSGLAVGGIVGDLGSDWEDLDIPVVHNNVADITEIKTPEVLDEEEPDETVHRIIGRSIMNDYDPDFDDAPLFDKGLADNYANGAMLISGETVAEGTATDIEGETKTASELVAEFFKSLGFVYGNTSDEPWSGEGIPVLYFEEQIHTDGIESTTETTRPELSIANDAISAATAARIDVYALNGRKVASSIEGTVGTQRLAAGSYIVVLTAQNGKTFTQKVIIK